MVNNNSKLKVIVFGATGTTGSAVVERALECGYAVTAFVRNPEKISTSHPNLTVFKGDVLDPASVERPRRRTERHCSLRRDQEHCPCNGKGRRPALHFPVQPGRG